MWLLIDALGEPGATLSNTAEHFGVPVDIHRHAGVLLVSPERFPLQRRAPGALVAALERFIETTTAELTDVVVWLTE